MNREATLSMRAAVPAALCLALTLGAVHLDAQQRPAPRQQSQQDKIASAMSAAPESVARNATILDWPSEPGGEARQLRAGTNGWVCYPSTPAAVSAAGEDPMCLDRTFQAWVRAWMTRTPPRLTGIGVAYMLRGDMGVSNTDPFAREETPTNQWIRSGPHIMVATPDTAQLNALPTDPNNGGPWVMWKGTPYAHVMVPLGSMPARAPMRRAMR